MDDKEKEEYDREEREDEWRQEQQEEYDSEGEKCEDCGTVMRYECISSDADGNRQEMGYVCPKCD